ncbi:MAG TPA: A/G-specific adenine glycosylase [Candidatus Woesebacteria bacterium]|nr:A/G-specific adenine glycosylase [Candidatus Woesebacteria bacterium]
MRKQEIESFQRYITIWYQKYGRHTLPWRLTTDPYAILVSELMLQQTQVSRVIPKYKVFLKRFPNLKSLKSSSLADVLIFWQGLGYNRRAKYLWQLAKTTQILPSSQVELEKLPGIGPYTASAICAFAFNQPTPMIETNIRSVFLYHFFPDQKNVSDRDLVPLVSSAVDQSNPRRWYWALMDYGSYLKTILPNPNRRSKQHAIQSMFEGSSRQVRGEIIKILTQQKVIDRTLLFKTLKSNQLFFEEALEQLLTEGFIIEIDKQLSLK